MASSTSVAGEQNILCIFSAPKDSSLRPTQTGCNSQSIDSSMPHAVTEKPGRHAM